MSSTIGRLLFTIAEFPFPCAQPSHTFPQWNADNDAAEKLRTYTEGGGIEATGCGGDAALPPGDQSASREFDEPDVSRVSWGPLADSGDLPDVTRSRIKGLHAYG